MPRSARGSPPTTACSRSKSWRAELLVEPWKRNGVKVSGEVEADITQQCVVTLEPIEARISEEVSGLYFSRGFQARPARLSCGGEVQLDAEGPDSPETFSGETIDVGALAEEFFGAGHRSLSAQAKAPRSPQPATPDDRRDPRTVAREAEFA